MGSINYTAPPICATFMASNTFGRLIAGPVGSGKTTACIMELLRRAIEQHPGDDGLRHTRFAIVRQTLDQLKKTVLKDIQNWFAGIHEWRVSESTIYFKFADVRSEWILIPLEEEKDQQRLLSSQLTGVWFSEAIEIDVDLLAPASGRCGRYPMGRHGVPTWAGMIADTNFPTEGSPWHGFMENAPSIWKIFKQPGGLSPGAENLPWLNQTEETLKLPETDPRRIQRGLDYYLRLAENVNKDWINRYVHARYGSDPSGTAVYKLSFKRSFHVTRELEPVRGKLLLVGQDFGRQPWSLISQLDFRGRLLILEEVDGTDTGLEQHLRMNLRPALMNERYMGHPVCLVGDPSGRNKSSLYETNEFDLIKEMGFSGFPAPTNDLDPRIRAVEKFFGQQCDGGGNILIDEDRCPRLVEGLSGLYRFAKTKVGASKPQPDKNQWSHVNDDLQYICLVAGNPGAYSMVYGRVMGGRKTTRNAPPVRAWA